VIGILMLVIEIVMMRFRRLLEEVVHLMGRRINQKKEKRCRPKRGSRAL
jgi:hypothetical protein